MSAVYDQDAEAGPEPEPTEPDEGDEGDDEPGQHTQPNRPEVEVPA